MDNIKEIQSIIHEFSKERDWFQYHNGKDLAISINLEAAELLECFQWLSNEEANQRNLEQMKDELADILMYCIRFADCYGFDIEEIIRNKLKKVAQKYPIKK